MIATLAEQWIAEGHRVSLFSPGDWSDQNWSMETYGQVTIHKKRLRLPKDPNHPVRGFLGWLAEFPSTLFSLRTLIKRENIDLIHLHTIREYQYYFRILNWFNYHPYVLTFHGTDALSFAESQQTDIKLLRWIAQGATAITAVSSSYARLIEQHHPNLKPVHHIANGIDLTPLPPPKQNVKIHSLPTLPKRFFVIVGWIEPPKAQDVAVKAWALLKKHHPDLHLLIIGDQPLHESGEAYYPDYWNTIQDLISDSMCTETVHLVGTLDPPTLSIVLSQATGLVFPSHREGLPYVLLEAGRAGLPVVCNDIPAFSDIIISGKNGFLTPDGDHEALAEAVNRIASDPNLAQSLGKSLFQTIGKTYSAKQMATGYLDLFHTLVF